MSALIQAIRRAARRFPSPDYTCSRCGGSGTVGGKTCPICGGSGEHR